MTRVGCQRPMTRSGMAEIVDVEQVSQAKRLSDQTALEPAEDDLDNLAQKHRCDVFAESALELRCEARLKVYFTRTF